MDMLNGKVAQKVIYFTLPLMFSGLLQAMFNAADMVVISNFGGGSSLAAVGATQTLYEVLINLFMGISVGIDVCCSFCRGIGDEKGMKQVIDTALMAALPIGIGVGMVGFFVSPSLLTLMGTPVEDGVYDGAVLYLRIIFLGVPFLFFYNFCAAVLRTFGDTRTPFLTLAIGGATNAVLNVILVAGFSLDVLGVAIATAFSQLLSATLIFIKLLRNTGTCSFRLHGTDFSFRRLGKIVGVGIPAGLQGSIFAITNTFLQSAVNTFGGTGVAGNTAANTVESFLWLLSSSYQYATVTFISQNFSAGKFDRVKRVFLVNLCLACGTGIFFGVGAYLARMPLMRIFIKNDPEAFAFALERLTVTYPLYCLAGIMGTVPSAIRGLGYNAAPTLTTVFGAGVVRILWVYTVFRARPSIRMLYLSYPITWTLTDAILILLFVLFYKKEKKKRMLLS